MVDNISDFTCSQEVSRSDNYSKIKDNLKALLSRIIFETPKNNSRFRCDVTSYSESLKKPASLWIQVDSCKKALSKIPVRIQFPGYFERWIVDIYLSKDAQKFAQAFYSELKTACGSICKEDLMKHLAALPTEKKQAESEMPIPSQPSLPPIAVAEAEIIKETTNTVVSAQPERKKRTRTVEIVTEQVILRILEYWRKNNANKILQTEFRKISAKIVGTKINALLVVALLKKKGLINIIPTEQRPMVEMTKKALSWLEEKEQAQAEKEFAQKTLEFSGQSLAPLKILLELQTIYTQIGLIKAAQENISQQIANLEIQSVQLKEDASERMKELERLFSLLNPEQTTELIATAEKAAK